MGIKKRTKQEMYASLTDEIVNAVECYLEDLDYSRLDNLSDEVQAFIDDELDKDPKKELSNTIICELFYEVYERIVAEMKQLWEVE